MPTLGALLLAAANMLAPYRYKIELPPPLTKYKVGCFIGIHSVFAGDVLSPIKISTEGEITFFSLDWNAKVRLVNAGCIFMENRLITPTVYKNGDIKNNSNNNII